MTLRTGVLSRAGFRRLWVASAAESVADDVGRTVIPLIAVATLGAGAFEIGVLNALSLAAFLVLGVPIGVWVDRARKRRILIGSDLVRAAAVATLPLVFFLGELTIWHLFAVSVVVGTADVFFTVAQSTVLPRLVDTEELHEATSRIATIQAVATIASPGLSGVLLKAVAAPLALVVPAMSYLSSAALATGLQFDDAPTDRSQRPPFRRSAAEGLRFTVGHPVLRALFLCTMTINAANMFVNAAHVVFVVTVLQINVATTALLGVFQAVGALLGSLAAGPIVRRLGIGRTKILGTLLLAPAVVILPAARWGPGPAEVYVAASNFCWGFVLVVAGLAGAGLTARLTPAPLLGRVTACSRLFGMGIMPIASLVGGAIGALAGTTTLLWLGAVLVVFSAAPIAVSPLRRWKVFPVDQDVANA